MKERIVIGLFLKRDEERNVHTTHSTCEKSPEKEWKKCQKRSGIHEDGCERKMRCCNGTSWKLMQFNPDIGRHPATINKPASPYGAVVVLDGDVSSPHVRARAASGSWAEMDDGTSWGRECAYTWAQEHDAVDCPTSARSS